MDEEIRVKIAIPTDDGITIFSKMLGMAKYLNIYEIENGAKFRLIEKRDNPYAATMQHLKTLDVYELIQDCSIVIAANIGKRGINRLQERGMQLVFKKGKIEQALIEFSHENRKM
ncbi:hypothetical protein JW964_14935 [candidate division KSB1 bacterium]|nr:hypothetical protein [candidate division KSB1 bacterium]